MMINKPCPFCGKNDLWETSNGEDNYWVMCNKCGAEGPTALEKDVWDAWNTRPNKQLRGTNDV